MVTVVWCIAADRPKTCLVCAKCLASSVETVVEIWCIHNICLPESLCHIILTECCNMQSSGHVVTCAFRYGLYRALYLPVLGRAPVYTTVFAHIKLALLVPCKTFTQTHAEMPAHMTSANFLFLPFVHALVITGRNHPASSVHLVHSLM